MSNFSSVSSMNYLALTLSKLVFYYWIILCACPQETRGINEEYEFVFSVPEVINSNTPHVLLTTSSSTLVSTNTTIHGTDFEVHNTLTRDSFVDIPLPNFVYMEGTGINDSKTVVVRADAKISVHVMANNGLHGDGFLVLPKRKLGTNHYVLSYEPLIRHQSFICVSSTENTKIDIITPEGEKHLIVLQPYHSYQLTSMFIDLTGSQVISDYPITVIAGTQCSLVGGGACDALIEQMPPVSLWGTRVTLSPFAGKDNGCTYRIKGTNVTTEVMISSGGTRTLLEGQWFEQHISANDIVTIVADFPILVMQYIRGGGSSQQYADPSMILAPSSEMYVRGKVTFPIFDVGLFAHHNYIHVLVDCRYVTGLKFDNSTVSNWETLVSSDGEMCSIRGHVLSSDFVHTVNHVDSDARFTVAVYGLRASDVDREWSSYAYLADIENIQLINDPRMTMSGMTTKTSTETRKDPHLAIDEMTTIKTSTKARNDHENQFIDHIIISVIVGGVVLVMVTICLTILCLCYLKRNQASKNDTSSHYSTADLPISTVYLNPKAVNKESNTPALGAMVGYSTTIGHSDFSLSRNQASNNDTSSHCTTAVSLNTKAVNGDDYEDINL